MRQIFAEDGEEAFRALETQVLREALDNEDPVVIAAAGGVVLRADNRQALADAGAWVVWLSADPALLAERVRSGCHRPLLDGDPAAKLQALYVEREPLYRAVADAIVTVDHRSVNEVVDAVLR